jgi:hypothetical protein
MPIEGVDLSFARPGGAALSAAGKRFVVRYLTGKDKALTAHEVTDYHAQGLGIALVFESTRGRAREGKAAGTADAKAAAGAATKRGVPESIPIYFAVDFDADPDDWPAIEDYFRAVVAEIGIERVGVYGGIFVVRRCHNTKVARWFWQTYAWSDGKILPYIHLYQYRNGQLINGGKVDFDRAYRPNYGQWPQPLPPSTGQRYKVTIRGGAVRLFSEPGGSPIGAVSLASYVCRRDRVDGVWFYRIIQGSRTGQAFKPNRFTTARFV